jgi:hypothetical protein
MNDINAAQRLRVAAADKAEAAKILVRLLTQHLRSYPEQGVMLEVCSRAVQCVTVLFGCNVFAPACRWSRRQKQRHRQSTWRARALRGSDRWVLWV